MNNQSNAKTTILIVLVALLVLAVAVQSFYLFKMHTEMNAIAGGKEDNAAIAKRQQATLPKGTTVPWFDDEWLNTPFDPDAWNPFDEMEQMQERMNSIFNNAFGRFGKSSRFGHLYHEPAFSPKLDLEEETDRYIIRIDMPGTDEAKIDIQVKDQTLRVRGRREEHVEEADKDGHMITRERRIGQFDRSVGLPGPVDEAKMTTSYKNGILTIILPKENE